MEVTFKQAFSLLDGRLSTDIGDVYDMLNYIFTEHFMTHELPGAYDIIKQTNPEWYSEGVKRLNAIKALVGNEFEDLMKYIDDNMSDEYVTLEKI